MNEMQRQRRIFLQGSMAGSAVAVAVGAGLLSAGTVMAAWPEQAFQAQGSCTVHHPAG